MNPMRRARRPLRAAFVVLAWVLLVLLQALVGAPAAAADAGTAPELPAVGASEPARDCPPAATLPDPAVVEQARLDARDRGFLWRIERDGRRSHLFGTVHVARFDWMFPGPTVRRALDASDTVALELDLLDPEIQRRMLAGQRRGAAALPDPLAQRLAAQFRIACVDAAALAAFSPEMQIATLTVLAARRDGLDPGYGIDAFLAAFGRGAKKAVVSLETPEAQLAALQAEDDAGARVFVDAALAELESGRVAPMLLRIATVWAESDTATLMRYDEWCECRKSAAERDAMKRLLDDRNPVIAERIDALHRGGQRVFAAVGSLHMIGPNGLPALLARRGYRVERIAWPRR